MAAKTKGVANGIIGLLFLGPAHPCLLSLLFLIPLSCCLHIQLQSCCNASLNKMEERRKGMDNFPKREL